MYWPIGTPRIYATSSSRAPTFNLVISNDGLPGPPSRGAIDQPRSSLLSLESQSSGQEELELQTPITPTTPAIQSVEHEDQGILGAAADPSMNLPSSLNIPLADPVLALRVSRTGHLFAVITATSITIWQTKVGSDFGTPLRTCS
jgi:RAB6A-GEF complex partner protein 1